RPGTSRRRSARRAWGRRAPDEAVPGPRRLAGDAGLPVRPPYAGGRPAPLASARLRPPRTPRTLGSGWRAGGRRWPPATDGAAWAGARRARPGGAVSGQATPGPPGTPARGC